MTDTAPTMQRFLLTLAVTDPTDLTPDVEKCEVASIHEVYPDPPGDPVWIGPVAAVVFDPAVLRLVLNAAMVGLEGAPEEMGDVDAAWHLARTIETHLLNEAAL